MSVVWRGVTLDERTAAMMDEVARLSGDVYVRPTQGSYAGGGVQASAGTHDGAGAIDIAGQDEGMTQADREVIQNAGRQVGFAMWIRSPDQSDWPWHIHGIAVQPDGQWDTGGLSDGAHGQVIDYYEGRNGLASGAPDDGPRDWVGITWETYEGDDMPSAEEVAAAVWNYSFERSGVGPAGASAWLADARILAENAANAAAAGTWDRSFEKDGIGPAGAEAWLTDTRIIAESALAQATTAATLAQQLLDQLNAG